jgi:hypothetical protein
MKLSHGEGVPVEKVMWLVLGAVTFVAAVRASRSLRAMYLGRAALGVLFIVFGALVNAVYLLVDSAYYAEFGEQSQFAFVRETWASVVVPNQVLWISLLIAFEATMGVLVLCGGRWTRAALTGLIAFHAGVLFFGWALWAWAIPMMIALALLLRAERYWSVMAGAVSIPTAELSRHDRT